MIVVNNRDHIGEQMVEGKINPKTGEIFCPLCNSEHLTTFRKDELTDKVYLNHCKCESCGQLFVYKTVIMDKRALYLGGVIPPEREFITISELAKILGISRIAVYKKVKKGHIKAMQIGRGFAISTDYIRANIAGIKTTLLEEEELLAVDRIITEAMQEYGSVFKGLGKS